MIFVCTGGTGRLQVAWGIAARDLQVSDGKDDGYLLADGALQYFVNEGSMRTEGAWILRVGAECERGGRSRMMNRKERVERNGAGAFLVSIDGRCLN